MYDFIFGRNYFLLFKAGFHLEVFPPRFNDRLTSVFVKFLSLLFEAKELVERNLSLPLRELPLRMSRTIGACLKVKFCFSECSLIFALGYDLSC